MDTTVRMDVEPLNEQLFLFAINQREGIEILESLGAIPEVVDRIRGATPNGIAVAVRCGIPLVCFSAAMEEELIRGASMANSVGRPVPIAAVQELALLALHIAYRNVLRFPALGQSHFGLSRVGSSRLAEATIRDLICLSRFERPIQLHAADQLRFWDRILIGDRLVGPRAYRISQETAFLSVGAV